MAPLTWPEIRPRIIHARAANAIGAASKRSAAAGTVRVASMPEMVRQSLVHFLGHQWTLGEVRQSLVHFLGYQWTSTHSALSPPFYGDGAWYNWTVLEAPCSAG